ncbi:MAG TPA: LamG-like jellyroll fold domain-containing protein [Candidatus Saccharimonadales bacterium]|nr:LamG-like jellyroll fold domain-containing protein [Candidatus Saccharimonadales bacterium]
MKIKIFLQIAALSIIVLGFSKPVSALTPGALIYRTSSDGKMYGYSDDSLLEINEQGILEHINSGHVGIYVGRENGEDYVVEALAGGIVKTEARYFINEANNEELLGAKLPTKATALELAKVVKIANSLVGKKLGYDFDFKIQKGPDDGEWTCVGLTEKIYESANISNPNNLGSLEYDPNYYALDITPDGFNNHSFVGNEGDCFSKTVEFSKIEKRRDLRLPLPEIVGFNAGLEYAGERYIFLPYTQFLQSSLRSEIIDINLKTFFDDAKIRGQAPINSLILRWSLINNPISSLKIIASEIGGAIVSWKDKIFGAADSEAIVLNNDPEKKNNQSLNNADISNNANHLPLVEINSADKSKISDDQEVTAVTVADVTDNQEENIKINYSPTSEESRIENNNNEAAVAQVNIVSAPLAPTILELSETATKLITPTKITSNSSNSGSAEEISKNITPGISKISAGIKPASTIATNNQNQTVTSSFSEPLAIISKIYSTENNDFIELYNPTDYGFDLAEAGFRLEKAKTATDPGLMMRIGNTSDGLYPGGTVIKAKSYYLIVRDDANNFYKSRADAIALRNEFSLTADGYIIYLGKGAISSSADEDIIDAVGFGSAVYFRGLAPAVKIEDNYVLNRISEYNDNSKDFNLIISDDPGIVWDEENSGSVDNSNNDSSQNSDDNNNQANDALGLFVEPPPLESEGITNLWHFSECYGEQTFSVGKFDCALVVGEKFPKFKPSLNSEINLNQFSLSFYYSGAKVGTISPKLKLDLSNSDGQAVNLLFSKGMLQIEGLPNSAWRYYLSSIFATDAWHHFSLVVNQADGYWAVNIDGQEVCRENFVQTLASNFFDLEVSGDGGGTLIDELVFWNRSLEASEIAANSLASAPFSPIVSRVSQTAPELKYFWDFNEGYELVNEGGGTEALDEITGLKLKLPENSWVWRSADNTGIINTWGKDIAVNLPSALNSKDLSLAFWWRGQLESNEGRSIISLSKSGAEKMSLIPEPFRHAFFFNNNYGIFSEGYDVDIPHDTKWHHLALTFDSYRYQLKFFVDGEEKRSLPYFWIKDGEEPNHLEIRNELDSIELDDLSIWEGALRPFQIQNIYEQSKIE